MRMRIPGHRIVVLLGITLLMVLGCQTPPGPLLEGEGTSLDSPAAERHPLLEGEACRTLENIDSLMWQQPDSAFALLQAFAVSSEADSLDEFDIHYFQLLLSELLYKNDCEQTNRKDLLRAVAYYDSIAGSPGAEARGMSVGPFRRRDASHASAKTTAFLAARAHYINGVGCYERDSVVEACKEYLKALETMEERFAEKELVGNKARFMALTYTHLTELFSNQYLHEQAIYFAKLSLQHYNKCQALPWHMAWVLDEIGANYDMMEELDSAYYYYRKASFVLGDSNPIMSRDIAARKALLAYKMERLPEKPLEQLNKLLAQAESQKEYLTRCALVGEIYYHEKQFDSAQVYLDRVFKETDNQNLKRQEAKWLIDICKAQGKEAEIVDYARFTAPFATIDEDNSTTKTQLTELYKTFFQEKLEQQHNKETGKHFKYVLAVVAVMLIIILTISLLYHNNKKRKQHLETLIESERQAHQVQQAALSGRLRRSNEELREVKEQIRRQEDADAKTEHAASFAEEPICRLIMERVNEGQFMSQVDCKIYKDYALNKEQLSQLRNAADGHFNQFTIRVSQAHPELTRLDLDYCCLYLLGLTDADISALMQRAYNTVNERNSKLRRVLGSEKPVAVTLQAIANELVL